MIEIPMIRKPVDEAETKIKNSEYYDTQTSLYNSKNIRCNSYYPQHATQQNTINQLNSQISSKTSEYNNYMEQILLIEDNIIKEGRVIGTLNEYLEDFE